MKRTNKETELKIIEYYNVGNSMKDTGKEFGLNQVTVFNILNRYGIQTRTKGGIYALPKDEIISKYKSGKSCEDIAKEYGVTFGSISKVLESSGIPRNNIYHNLTLIEDYWENIDSPDKAYFLGFLLTDGNVTGNQVRIELASKDSYILETLRRYTKNSNKISHLDRGKKGKFSSFHAKRKKWVLDLSKYGVVPNKTYITEMPTLSPDMIPHLIRGMIDGDGWITVKGNQLGFCGSEKCVTQLRDYLVKTLGVYNVVVIHQRTHVWQVTWSGKMILKR